MHTVLMQLAYLCKLTVITSCLLLQLWFPLNLRWVQNINELKQRLLYDMDQNIIENVTEEWLRGRLQICASANDG